MSEQPILEGSRHEDWEHVAREFHDHDLEHEGGWNPSTTMEPVGSAYYVGDWLPAEPICKEVVRLRRALAEITELRDRAENVCERGAAMEHAEGGDDARPGTRGEAMSKSVDLEFEAVWDMVEEYVDAEVSLSSPAMDGVAHNEAILRSNDAWQTLRDKIKSILGEKR